MIIRVKGSFTPECWYSELLGELFMTFSVPHSPMLHFNNLFFFYPQDVEIVQNPVGMINYANFNNNEIA